MKVTKQDVLDLRERTGAGIFECKKALGEAYGDQERAIEYLKKHSGAHEMRTPSSEQIQLDSIESNIFRLIMELKEYRDDIISHMDAAIETV